METLLIDALAVPRILKISEAGNFVQVNSDWNAVAGPALILNKPVIPTLTSQLTNDSGFITSADLPVSKYGEMYQFENTTITDIVDQSVYHSITNYIAGLLNGFTFKTGTSANILSIANYSGTVPGTVLITTSAAHGLLTGEPVTQVGTTDYNGTFIVTVVSATTYYITHAFTVTRTGKVTRGSTLKANAGSAGTYRATFTAVLDMPSNKTYKAALQKNALPLNNIVSAQNLASNSISESSPEGLITVVDGDYIWLAIMNQTNDSDVTVVYSNINLNRI